MNRLAEPRDLQRTIQVSFAKATTARFPPQPKVRHPRQMRNELCLFHHRAHPSELSASGHNGRPEQAHFTPRRPLESHQHTQRRRLARTVRTKKATYLTTFDSERKILDRATSPNFFHNLLDRYKRLRHGLSQNRHHTMVCASS